MNLLYLQVKDAAASIDPWIQIPDLSENLGHVALAEGRMKDALQLYNHVQRRFHKGTSAELLQLSARALYDQDSRKQTGGETDKPSLLPEARVHLMKAIHLDPSNHQMRFNAATVMQVCADNSQLPRLKLNGSLSYKPRLLDHAMNKIL